LLNRTPSPPPMGVQGDGLRAACVFGRPGGGGTRSRGDALGGGRGTPCSDRRGGGSARAFERALSARLSDAGESLVDLEQRAAAAEQRAKAAEQHATAVEQTAAAAEQRAAAAEEQAEMELQRAEAMHREVQTGGWRRLAEAILAQLLPPMPPALPTAPETALPTAPETALPNEVYWCFQ